MKNIEEIRILEIPEESIKKDLLTIAENKVLDSEDFSDWTKTLKDKKLKF